MSANLDPVATFRTEARELLERVEQALLDLSNRPDDRTLVDEVFRGFHTLKGSGAMFGFDALASFTHHCETAFDKVRKGEVAATKELVSTVLAAQDHMRFLIEGGGSSDPAVYETLLERLARDVEEQSAVPSTPQNREVAHSLCASAQCLGQRLQPDGAARRAARSRRLPGRG